MPFIDFVSFVSIHIFEHNITNTKRPVDNVVIATKGLQDRNINILAGTTVENKGKLILNNITARFYY